MTQKYVKTNIRDNLAKKALKFCGDGEDAEFRNLSQMTDFALMTLIQRLEERED